MWEESYMYYTVYKITNTISGRYYIGKHQTKNLNDGYMGSGKILLQAYKKYGKEKFTKEILHIFNTEEEMNSKEKELVIISEDSYNICPGGNGGFGYINGNNIGKFRGKNHSEETKQKIREKRIGKSNYTPTQEYKKRMSQIMKDKHKNNSGFNKRA